MKATILNATSVLMGLLAIGLSLVSSPEYLGPVSLALGFALVGLVAGIAVLTTSQKKAKWLILVILIPVAVFSVDNLGRFMMCMGCGGFRILI
jgi:hypothetical protein